MIYKDKIPEDFSAFNIVSSTTIDDDNYLLILDTNSDYSCLIDENRKIKMYFDPFCNGYNLKGDVVVKFYVEDRFWGYSFNGYENTVWTNHSDIFQVECIAAAELIKGNKL